jgi:hypothetical protein
MGTMAQAQFRRLVDLDQPTEAGSTNLPSGNYVITDESTGKSYPMTVTSQGTMIIGPSGTTTQSLSNRNSGGGIKRTLEREVENMIK